VKRSTHWIILGLLLMTGLAQADFLAVGSRLEPFSLQDQHAVEQTVDEKTRLILFSRDMEGGKLLKEALSEVEAETLALRGAVYVADISGMPKLVARLFALPSMRKRPYPMLLDRDGSTTASLPDVEGSATLIFLEQLEIVRIEHVETAEDVRESLETQ
jgi:hypothetical protein